MTGRIKTINTERGFLFVTADEGGVEYFAHRTGCADFDSLTRGQQVTFQTEPSERGPRCVRVAAEATTA